MNDKSAGAESAPELKGDSHPSPARFVLPWKWNFTIFMAAATLLAQTFQFFYTARQQRQANEDTQWREAIKDVSFQDSSNALVGALSMQGFFGSPTYGSQASSITVALLPLISSDPEGFDEVFFEMLKHNTGALNQDSVLSISRTILDSQRTLYSSNAIAALQDGNSAEAIDSMLGGPAAGDFQEKNQHDSFEHAATISWELDSVSQSLQRLWTAGKVSPPSKHLEVMSLEDADFHTIDLSGVSLASGVVYKVWLNGVKFGNANLHNTLIRHVCLNGADLTEIKNFDGSQWTDVNWQSANLSDELKTYLNKNYQPGPDDQNEATCQQPPGEGKWF